MEASPLHNAEPPFAAFPVAKRALQAATRQQRRGEMGLQRMANEFASYFAASLLRQACGIATHHAMTRQEYTIPLLDEVLRKVEAGNSATPRRCGCTFMPTGHWSTTT